MPLGHNPVPALEDMPIIDREEAGWLEVHDCALLLEAARLLPRSHRRMIPFAYPLVSTFPLTGGRQDEVFSLQVEDVSFERKTVYFGPNEFRRGKKGKTRHAARIVPLMPQLEEILGEYLLSHPPSNLLFPSWVNGEEHRLTDIRKVLGLVTKFAGLPRITTKHLRHTYCSARLQTMDRGEPVSLDTVRREMGHGDEWLVRNVYGHLGQIRHRRPVVEYPVDQHLDVLGDRLGSLRARVTGTTCDTAQGTILSPRWDPDA